MSKKVLGLLTAFALMSSSSMYAENSNDLRPEDIDTTTKKPPVPKGCQKYVYKESFGTLEVIALNEKSALRKYNKWCNANARFVV